MKKIKLVDVEVSDKKLDLTRIKNAKTYPNNIYDQALLEIEKDFGLDDDDIIVKALERAKKVEELLKIYKQYYDGFYLTPGDQKRKQELEKELSE